MIALADWGLPILAALVALVFFAFVLRWTRFRSRPGSGCACDGGAKHTCGQHGCEKAAEQKTEPSVIQRRMEK